MQHEITTSLWCSLSESGFSLDELVLKLKKLFDSEGFSGLLELLLNLTQENLLLSSNRRWCDCESSDYILNGSYPRKVKTSVGVLNLTWRRLKCKCCKVSSIVPLKSFLGIKSHQYKSNELERLVIDGVTKDSYRRSMESLSSYGFTRVSHTTAHRWVMESDCDHFNFSNKIEADNTAVQLIPDGTGFKGKPNYGKADKGDLKVIVAVDNSGTVFPIGAWTGEDWQTVSDKVKKAVPKFPEDSILVADGEPGIANAFADMFDEHQRCHWHITRDMYHAMWQDGGTVKDSKPIQEALTGILAVELPKEDFEYVSESEKDDIEEQIEKSEEMIDSLIKHLHRKNYDKAATYLENSKKAMFGYVRRWLKTGIICPRASSLIERVVREVARRIKKVAYNWSNQGCAKMARILLKKFTDENQWKQFWNEKMKIQNKVMMGIRKITPSSQNLGH